MDWGDVKEISGKCLWRKARQPWKQGNTAESCIGGEAVTLASLSPHASTGSWTIERLACQTPEALNYRVGPHPEGPFKCLMCWTTEGPQAREPSMCMQGQSYGERLAKEAFWSPATRGSNKDSDGAITPAVEAVHVPSHLMPPGSLQAKQLCHLHAQVPLGQSCHRQKKSWAYECRVPLVVSNSLQPCRLWLTRLLVREGGSPGKNTGVYWPILVALPF